MATATAVQLGTGQYPEYYRDGISSKSSQKASELLSENHNRHHIFFNSEGFHNHIGHHLLTIWALNASPKDLQRGYDTNRSYQRPMPKPDSTKQQELQDPKKFISYLGPEKY